MPLCTVVCAELRERDDGSAVLTMASAGHPPPLLVRGGEVLPVGDPGTIAGAFDGELAGGPRRAGRRRPARALHGRRTDAVGEYDRFGEARLRQTLGGLEGQVGQRVAALHAALQRFQRGPQRDDTTVLVLQYGGRVRSCGSAQRREPPRRLVDDLVALAEREAHERAAGGLVVVEDAGRDRDDAGARRPARGRTRRRRRRRRRWRSRCRRGAGRSARPPPARRTAGRAWPAARAARARRPRRRGRARPRPRAGTASRPRT